MDWDALSNFVIKIGVPSILILSIPVLAWKYLDYRSRSKRNGK